MQLLIPRTPAHLAAAWSVATDAGFGPDGSDAYLTILGVYPASSGATCANTALASGNPSCGWVAGDGGLFWVSELAAVAEPDGDNAVDASMAYAFDGGGAATSWTDSPSPGATAARFICGDVDKVFPQPTSCLAWRDLGFTTSREYVIDPDGTYTSNGLCNWTLPWANTCPPCDAHDMSNTLKDWIMKKNGTGAPLFYETSCSHDDGGAFTMRWFVR